MDFSIGNNNQNLLTTYSDNTGVENAGSSNSIWGSIFSDMLPSLFQSGAALLANNRNARAQEEIARNQGGIMNWMQGITGYNYNGMQPRNNSWIWMILGLVLVVVLFFIFKKK